MSTALHEAVALTVHAGGAAEILIDRPERHNAMSMPMYEALLTALERCQADPAIRCVMLRGAGGKSFIAGTDISHFQDFHHGQQGVAYEAFVERMIDAVERIAVPTIAVIDGWAVGGGLALATACDFRICSTGSRFGAPIAKTLSNTLSSRNIARLVASLGRPRPAVSCMRWCRQIGCRPRHRRWPSSSWPCRQPPNQQSRKACGASWWSSGWMMRIWCRRCMGVGSFGRGWRGLWGDGATPSVIPLGSFSW
jgi:hypothetical protein